MKWLWVWCWAGMALSASGTDTTLVATNAAWKYRDIGSNEGTAWRAPGFDDSGWASGSAPLGYGDPWIVTTNSFGPDANNKYITTYYRRSFNVPDPSLFKSLRVRLLRDDGAIVYLNGTEIRRDNLPPDPITFTTHALAAIGGADESTYFETSANPAGLVTGTNVLAVEIHQVQTNSSDIGFALQLIGTDQILLTRGPFIQMPNSNQVTVVWRTDGTADSAVDYGLDTSYGAGTVADPALVTEHVIHIGGLLPGTNYFYRVRSAGTNLTDATFSFHTKPATNQAWRMVIIGDFGDGSASMSNVAARVNALQNVDLFLTVGDNIYPGGEAASYDPWWFSLYAPTMRHAPCFPALGNHDVVTANGQPFVDNFYLSTNGPPGYIEKNYSYDFGNAHFVVVDSNPFANNDATAIAAIKSWVSNDLAGTSQPWKFVYFHHPPYTSQSNGHNDDLSVQTNLMPIVQAAGVQMIFQGHNHWYERLNAINGTYHITTGAGGNAGLHSVVSRKAYSAVLLTNTYCFTVVDIAGKLLHLQQINTNGVVVDEFRLDLGHPFKLDGLLDDPNWQRADNGLKLYAAIRQNFLYLATQDAGEGNDHFLYLATGTNSTRTANWSKTGNIVQWSAFLADENDNAFNGWFGDAEQPLTDPTRYRSMTAGLNGGVLEGTLDLSAHLGAFPQQLFLSGSAYTTTNGGFLVTQVPAGQFLAVNTRDITLDLPVADAGTNQAAEAGMLVTLNGTGSTAPSGFPLTYNWTQLSGASVTLINSNAATANFTAGTAGARVFQLTVNDTRFSSNATTTVTITPLTDTDGDGMSDQEELTGQDNALTPANPAGATTNPNVADSDGDGQNDGAEALAGTNPNDRTSTFRVLNATAAGSIKIEWSAVPAKKYQVRFRDQLTGTWSNLTGEIVAATTITNAEDNTANGQPSRFYQVILLP